MRVTGPICTLIPPLIPRKIPKPFGPKVSSGPWKVDIDPIQLEHPGDTVVWDLSSLVKLIPGITKVELTFRSGRGAATPLGPFTNLAVAAGFMSATGSVPDAIQDCYCYNIEVTSSGDVSKVFPVDPQIDNLPPIPDTGGGHPPPKGGHKRHKRSAR